MSEFCDYRVHQNPDCDFYDVINPLTLACAIIGTIHGVTLIVQAIHLRYWYFLPHVSANDNGAALDEVVTLLGIRLKILYIAITVHIFRFMYSWTVWHEHNPPEFWMEVFLNLPFACLAKLIAYRFQIWYQRCVDYDTPLTDTQGLKKFIETQNSMVYGHLINSSVFFCLAATADPDTYEFMLLIGSMIQALLCLFQFAPVFSLSTSIETFVRDQPNYKNNINRNEHLLHLVGLPIWTTRMIMICWIIFCLFATCLTFINDSLGLAVIFYLLLYLGVPIPLIIFEQYHTYLLTQRLDVINPDWFRPPLQKIPDYDTQRPPRQGFAVQGKRKTMGRLGGGGGGNRATKSFRDLQQSMAVSNPQSVSLPAAIMLEHDEHNIRNDKINDDKGRNGCNISNNTQRSHRRNTDQRVDHISNHYRKDKRKREEEEEEEGRDTILPETLGVVNNTYINWTPGPYDRWYHHDYHIPEEEGYNTGDNDVEAMGFKMATQNDTCHTQNNIHDHNSHPLSGLGVIEENDGDGTIYHNSQDSNNNSKNYHNNVDDDLDGREEVHRRRLQFHGQWRGSETGSLLPDDGDYRHGNNHNNQNQNQIDAIRGDNHDQVRIENVDNIQNDDTRYQNNNDEIDHVNHEDIIRDNNNDDIDKKKIGVGINSQSIKDDLEKEHAFSRLQTHTKHQSEQEPLLVTSESRASVPPPSSSLLSSYHRADSNNRADYRSPSIDQDQKLEPSQQTPLLSQHRRSSSSSSPAAFMSTPSPFLLLLVSLRLDKYHDKLVKEDIEAAEDLYEMEDDELVAMFPTVRARRRVKGWQRSVRNGLNKNYDNSNSNHKHKSSFEPNDDDKIPLLYQSSNPKSGHGNNSDNLSHHMNNQNNNDDNNNNHDSKHTSLHTSDNELEHSHENVNLISSILARPIEMKHFRYNSPSASPTRTRSPSPTFEHQNKYHIKQEDHLLLHTNNLNQINDVEIMQNSNNKTHTTSTLTNNNDNNANDNRKLKNENLVHISNVASNNNNKNNNNNNNNSPALPTNTNAPNKSLLGKLPPISQHKLLSQSDQDTE